MKEGECIPEHGILGNPNDGYHDGLPGMIYMKVLQELWTKIFPSGAYWNPTFILSDNQMAAFETDTSTFIFAGEGAGWLTVDERVIYRRATKELVDQKGWDTKDIVMESVLIKPD